MPFEGDIHFWEIHAEDLIAIDPKEVMKALDRLRILTQEAIKCRSQKIK